MTRDEVIRGIEFCLNPEVACYDGCPYYDRCWQDGEHFEVPLLRDALALLKEEPKRGRWIALDMHKGMEQFKCSMCAVEYYVPTCMGQPMYQYCPNCGAKMEDGE